jgi:methyltransferase (TIGR00027 family)
MSEIKNVTGTAFVVAEFRAVENNQPMPLYRDPIVAFFLSDETRAAAHRVAASFPQVQDLVRIRTKYFDDMLERQLHGDVKQVVILGAGLDTRAVRKRAPGVTYFEIDDEATLVEKARCYREHGIDANVELIPGNYVTDGVIDLLRRHGFDPGVSTYVIWEGNTMYLPLEANQRILTELRQCVKRFVVSFDYMADTVIAKTTGDAGITRLVDSFAAMGAPWVSGFRDIRRFTEDLRLTVIENVRTADLFQTYWRGRPVTSPIFALYSVCTVAQSFLPVTI